MARRKKQTRKEQTANSLSRGTARAPRVKLKRKMRAVPQADADVKPAAVKLVRRSELQDKSASVHRSEGIRLFKLAGRPSKEDFIAVYGPAGPRMTWAQRAAAGVPAEKFQAALASAMRQAK